METTAKDPVCGMTVEIASAQWKAEYQGKMYYFCAPGCMRSFEQDPEKYLAAGPQVHMGDHGEHSHH